MKQSYYLVNVKALKRKDNTLELIRSDDVRRSIPVERVLDLYVIGELDLNAALLRFLGQHGICLHLFNYHEYYVGSFVPRAALVSGELLVRQVDHYLDPEKRVVLAKGFVQAAASNIYRNLRYYAQRGRNIAAEMSMIEQLSSKISVADSVQRLMGYEGNIRAHYYRAWNKIIKQDVDFEQRTRRPPDNMVNSLISFVNSLVYATALSEIYHTHLNPTISYLHEPGERRFSLCLDVAEVFKPLLADRMIFSLLNRMQVTEGSFDWEVGGLRMKPDVVRMVLKEYDDRLKTTINHRTLKRRVSYRRLIRLDIYKIVKHLLDEKIYEGFVIWW